MRSSEDPRLRDASIGLLHQLGLIDIHDEPSVKQAVPPYEQQERIIPHEPPSYEEATAGGLNVMISYNWGHQERAKIIKDSLTTHGWKPWMDLSDMCK